MTETDVGGVRSTMLGVNNYLPTFLHEPVQSLLTWVTGKPLPGQQPFIQGTSGQQLRNTVACLLVGVIAGTWLVHQGGFYSAAMPIAWLLVVSAARRAQVQIFHMCVHEVCTGNKKADRLIGEAISVVLFIAPFDEYDFQHVRLHHPARTFATTEDPDLAFLLVLGFKPGMSRSQLWRHLVSVLLSPRFHYLFLAARIRMNLFAKDLRRRLAGYLFVLALVGVAVATGNLPALLMAWVLPITVLYHMSALLQFVCEHRWLLERESDQSAKAHLARMTVGRFLGAPYPNERGLAKKAFWLVKMLGHALARVGVLVQGLPDHDWHHRHPASREWPNSVYARQRDIDAGCPEWPTPYQEVWGLAAAIDGVFTVFSELPPESVEEQPITESIRFPQTM